MHFHPVVPHKGKIEPLAEKLLPAVFAVRGGRISRISAQFGLSGSTGCIRDKCRRKRNRRSFARRPMPKCSMFRLMVAELCMTVRVVLACEDVAGAAHVGRQLIDLVDAIRHHRDKSDRADHRDELIGGRSGKFVPFQVDGPDPMPSSLRRLTRCPPMNPPAPFTRILFMFPSLNSSWQFAPISI